MLNNLKIDYLLQSLLIILYYRKLLVNYLLEISENEKEFTPLTVSQAIIYINKAWRQVSQSTIVNCWRKADILDNKNIDYSIDLNNFELDIFSRAKRNQPMKSYMID